MTNKDTFDRSLYVAALIENYLQSNPNATDSFEGITSWWVAKQKQKESVFEVSCALDFLIEKGVVIKVNDDLYRYAIDEQ